MDRLHHVCTALFSMFVAGAVTAGSAVAQPPAPMPPAESGPYADPHLDHGPSPEWISPDAGMPLEYFEEPMLGAACDAPFDIACDACDGYGCESCDGCGAFCLLGGHDMPYDFAHDTLGISEDSCFDVGGWVQFGYHNQSNGLFNSHPNRLRNHQSWIYMEKQADGSLGFDWGFRVDAMYGVDAADTQAFGNNPGEWDFENGYDHGIYGFAMPQLYAEVAYRGLSVKVGHFFTLLGYEVVTAPDNFFYSHSFTMYNSEAFTHTGALATYEVDDDITVYGGWTLGWDTGFDQFDDGSNFLGGFSLQLTDDATFTYITTIGNFGKIGDGYSHSMVLDLAVTDRLNYVLQSDLLRTNQPCVIGGGGGGAGGAAPLLPTHLPSDSTSTVGINQYLIYDVNEWLAVGGRAEWWKADGISYYGITGGLNLRPAGNLVIRPEVRYQWSPAANDFSGVVNANNPAGLPVDEGAIFGIDAILTF